MCKSKKAADVIPPSRARRDPSSRLSKRSSSENPLSPSFSSATDPSVGLILSHVTSSSSGRNSIGSLRDSISRNPNIYDIAEIRLATNNFLAKSKSATSKCWRCSLRGADTIVFQRKFRRKLSTEDIKGRLAVVCRSHHVSLTKLLGVSVSGDYIYLVYEFITGANLGDCLHNRINPSFTVLSTWISRIRVAADIAHAIDYIHNKTGLNLTLVHNFIKSSGIIISDSSLEARVCHFGTAYVCGDVAEGDNEQQMLCDKPFEGVRGYMSPEFRKTCIPTQEADVYAFGVIVLELLSGQEPLKYRFDSERGEVICSSLIDSAREVLEGGMGRLRGWVDRRLRDSFPVEVVESVLRLALECVDVDPIRRPDMARVAGKLSKLYLASVAWSGRVTVPDDQISVSLAPR